MCRYCHNFVYVKPFHTSNNVEATLSNAASRTILLTKSNVVSTLLPFLATMLPVGFGNNVERNFVLSTASKQTKHVQFVSTLSKGRNFVRHSFDYLLTYLLCQKATMLPKRQQCRSNIRICQKDEILQQTRSTLLLYLATNSNVASTLLPVWTGL